MTAKEAADILDPATTRVALLPYVYDCQRRLAVVEEACTMAAKVLRKIEPVDAALVVHGHWNILCESHKDHITGEVDEEFYLECSECHRKVWDVSQDAIISEQFSKVVSDFPYCHCGAKMNEEETK